MLMVMLLLMSNATIAWASVGEPDGVRSIFASFFFVQYLFPATSGGFGAVNGSIWTLTIEMLFYLTLPVLIYAFLGRRWRYGLPISIASSLLWVWLARQHLDGLVNHLHGQVASYGVPVAEIRTFLSTQYLAFVGEFGIGISVAGWWVRRGRKERERGGRFQMWIGVGTLFALAAALCLMYAFGGHHESLLVLVTARMGVAAAVGLMIMGFLAGPSILRRLLEFLPLRLYGVIGYSVFLWHLPILTIMATWPIFTTTDPTLRFWQIAAVGVPVTAIFGVVMYLLVERPFLTMRLGPLKPPSKRETSEDASSQPVIQPEAW
jgi:peptidoglycan/LPS O-acetylase OafA/YrhL